MAGWMWSTTPVAQRSSFATHLSAWQGNSLVFQLINGKLPRVPADQSAVEYGGAAPQDGHRCKETFTVTKTDDLRFHRQHQPVGLSEAAPLGRLLLRGRGEVPRATRHDSGD